jgi:hypothetical protein
MDVLHKISQSSRSQQHWMKRTDVIKLRRKASFTAFLLVGICFAANNHLEEEYLMS